MNRNTLQMSLLFLLTACLSGSRADDAKRTSGAKKSAEVIDIGSRLELFTDDFLIGKLSGGATQKLHQPKPHDVVLVTGEPWEGNTCAYYSIFQDGDLYRMYYRGSHFNEITKRGTHQKLLATLKARMALTGPSPSWGSLSSTAPSRTTLFGTA